MRKDSTRGEKEKGLFATFQNNLTRTFLPSGYSSFRVLIAVLGIIIFVFTVLALGQIALVI